jgi:O-antigen/teichoic acid export membrane protein
MLAVIDTRSRLEMMRYARQILFKTVVASVVAATVAAFGGGPVGIIFAELLVTLILSLRLVAVITKNIAKRLLWEISIRSFKRKDFSTALTLFSSTVLMFFSTNIDRWLAADRLGHDAFGLYAFAWISLTAALSFQALLNAGIFPLISKKRKEGNANAAFKTTAYISIATLLVGIAAASMVYLFAQWFLPNSYQRYAPALPLIMPLLLAAVLRLADFWSSYLIVMHRQNLLLKIQIFLILIPCFYYFSIGHSSVFTPINFAWLAVILAAGNYVLNVLAAILNKNEA